MFVEGITDHDQRLNIVVKAANRQTQINLGCKNNLQQYVFGRGTAKHDFQSFDCLRTQTVVNGAKQAVFYKRKSCCESTDTHKCQDKHQTDTTAEALLQREFWQRIKR